MQAPEPYPRIIAHRCGGALAPENTLVGLEVAARIGSKGVEFDVMMSQDGVLLLHHDDTLDRTTTGSGRLAELNAGAIREVDAGLPFHKAFAGTRVPSFDEALDRLQQLHLWANIEIKPAAGHEAATGCAVAMRLLQGWNGRGVVSSFSLDALRAARAQAPRLPLALLYVRLPENWKEDRDALNCGAVHLAAQHIDEATAAELGTTPWACYTVNSTHEAQRLFSLGCSAVFTDRPDLWR